MDRNGWKWIVVAKTAKTAKVDKKKPKIAKNT